MAYEREQAWGRYEALKKQIYEIGIKCNALTNDIREEIDSFDKDFSNMDFNKIETLAKELNLLQADYKEKAEKMNQLKKTYNL
ncbi:MAG: hypothetical protein KF816_11455 [Melioribacteraceae bacterium]|jgi:predicted RNase H-like nuclease (RuvC/YqgF family)|nr:hypothetical protein [Melioribacteraceae bacterium]